MRCSTRLRFPGPVAVIGAGFSGSLGAIHLARGRGLRVAGPATRSVLWEATAIPELRVQAQRIAEELTKP
jgi:uncharacterized NAD(P)/FAD-binding protein YdhS